MLLNAVILEDTVDKEELNKVKSEDAVEISVLKTVADDDNVEIMLDADVIPEVWTLRAELRPVISLITGTYVHIPDTPDARMPVSLKQVKRKFPEWFCKRKDDIYIINADFISFENISTFVEIKEIKMN
jgi:hypothetical protein